MEPRLYRTGAFAERAGVSVRALRLYDRNGLLAPSERSLSGHRLYSDADLATLGRILGLKLLGFTLAEIRALLANGPEDLPRVLAQQKAMLQDRAARLRRTIGAIAVAQARLEAGDAAPNVLLGIVRTLTMNESREWAHRHLTPEQSAAIAEIAERAYPTEKYQALRDRAWTEEQQAELAEGWNRVYADAERLAAAGADPAGPEGRDLGRRYADLLAAFTMGDPEIAASLDRFYAEAKALPPERNPYPPASQAAMAFAERACAAHRAAG